MPVTFSIAQADTERHDCRGLAVQLNGAPFCSPPRTRPCSSVVVTGNI